MNEQLIFLQSEPRGPSQQIEIPVTANGLNTVPIPDQPQLKSTTDRKIIIKAIRLIIPDVLTNALLSGNVNAPVTELQKMSLTLFSEGWLKGFAIPILTLNDMSLQGGTAPNAQQTTYVNNWVAVDWTKSFLAFSNGTVSAGAVYSVILDIIYLKFDKDGNEIRTGQ